MRKKRKGKKKVDQREPIYDDLGPCFMQKVSHTESDGMEERRVFSCSTFQSGNYQAGGSSYEWLSTLLHSEHACMHIIIIIFCA